MYSRYAAAENYRVAAEFKALADEIGGIRHTRYILGGASSGGDIALIGARNLEQLEPALAAGDFEMDESLYQRISDLSVSPPPATDRNEERTAANFGTR